MGLLTTQTHADLYNKVVFIHFLLISEWEGSLEKGCISSYT